MFEQINAGVCQDITQACRGWIQGYILPCCIQNFTYQGKTYGLPMDVAPIVLW